MAKVPHANDIGSPWFVQPKKPERTTTSVCNAVRRAALTARPLLLAIALILLVVLAIIGLLLVNARQIPELAKGEHVTPQRRAFIEKRSALDREVVGHYSSLLAKRPAISTAHPGGTPKVAFFFELGSKGLQTETVWEKFFATAPSDQYSIYIHLDKKGDHSELRDWPLKRYGAQLIPRVKAMWCATFGLKVAGLHAMLQDPRNVQLVVLSDTHAPMKSFRHVYHYLAELSPQTSKFCLASHSKYKTQLENLVLEGWPVFGHKCVFRDYYNRYEPGVWKHHTWIVVKRAHAETIVRRGVQALDTYHNASRQAVPDWALTPEGCSCEATALTAIVEEFRETHPREVTGDFLGDLDRMSVEQKCTSFVSWKNCFLGTTLNRDSLVQWVSIFLQQFFGFAWDWFTGSYDFVKAAREANIGNAFPHQFHRVSVEYLEGLTQEGFLFARKFYTETLVDTAHGTVPLSKVLPALWDKVDQQRALDQMWSRTDNWGQPYEL